MGVDASKPTAEPKRANGITAFVNVNVIPMDTERVLENQTLIVEGDRIVAVGPADEITFPENAVVVDGTQDVLSIVLYLNAICTISSCIFC